MSNNGAYGKLHSALDDVMVDADLVTLARLRVCAEAHNPNEVATFLAMLGIGDDLAANMRRPPSRPELIVGSRPTLAESAGDIAAAASERVGRAVA